MKFDMLLRLAESIGMLFTSIQGISLFFSCLAMGFATYWNQQFQLPLAHETDSEVNNSRRIDAGAYRSC